MATRTRHRNLDADARIEGQRGIIDQATLQAAEAPVEPDSVCPDAQDEVLRGLAVGAHRNGQFLRYRERGVPGGRVEFPAGVRFERGRQ